MKHGYNQECTYSYNPLFMEILPAQAVYWKKIYNRFYEAVLKLMNKQKNCKPCYKVAVELTDAVRSDLVLKYSNACDIIFLVGHGAKRGNKEYIRLKDREICLDE